MAMQNFFFVDIGNSRIKIAACKANDLATAIYAHRSWEIQTQPSETFDLSSLDISGSWFVCSVNRAASEKIVSLVEQDQDNHVQFIEQANVQIENDLESPTTTGIDRLCAALAANEIRDPDKAAIIVDSGTAVTIDLVDPSGIFQGGVIFPGISTDFRGLQSNTSDLPEIEINDDFDSEQVIGKNTEQAIQRGVYWSHRGAIESIVTRMTAQCQTEVDVFVTGGGGQWICQSNPNWNWHPTLVLEGVAITAAKL